MQFDHLALLIMAPFFGSFAQCVAERYPAGRPLIVARSACDACAVTLRPLELVPIASWLALRGRCRHCGSSIPVTHIAIEVLAIALTAWAIAASDGWILWVTAFLGWSLLALALMDCYFLVLADLIVLPLLAAGLAVGFVLSFDQGLAGLAGAAIGGGTSFLVRYLYRAVRDREGLGLGDVKLLAAAGAWLTWRGLPSAVLVAAAAALCFAALSILWNARLTNTTVLPFGAFIALGFWIVWLHGPIAFSF